MFGFGNTTLIISIEKVSNIMKIIKCLEESGLLIKGVSETSKNEANKQKGGFLSMSLGTLGASLLGSLLIGKGTIRAVFEMQKYYQNEPKFNGVYSRNNLLKIKDGAYVINLDEYKSIGNHWIVLYVNSNNRRASYDAIYFDSFGVENIPQEI